jgi:hypothetical protein
VGAPLGMWAGCRGCSAAAAPAHTWPKRALSSATRAAVSSRILAATALPSITLPSRKPDVEGPALGWAGGGGAAGLAIAQRWLQKLLGVCQLSSVGGLVGPGRSTSPSRRTCTRPATDAARATNTHSMRRPTALHPQVHHEHSETLNSSVNAWAEKGARSRRLRQQRAQHGSLRRHVLVRASHAPLV